MAVSPPPVSTVTPAASDKAQLRAELRAWRAAKPSSSFTPPSELRAAIGEARCVAAYVARGGEPDVLPLLGDAASACLPRIGDDNQMQFHHWQPQDPLETWRGCSQPVSDAAAAEPDLILVPLLGFDRAGNRLGQGGGHYDRALASHAHARKIGIGWAAQERDHLPTEPHDVLLDAIATEREWIVPERAS